MIGNPEERLRWLEKNQPRNIVAINAVRSRLNLPILPVPSKKFKERLGKHERMEKKWLNSQRALDQATKSHTPSGSNNRRRFPFSKAYRNAASYPFSKGYIQRQKAAVTIHY